MVYDAKRDKVTVSPGAWAPVDSGCLLYPLHPRATAPLHHGYLASHDIVATL